MIHHCIHKSPLFNSISIHSNLTDAFISFKSVSMLPCHLCPGLESALFPSGFPAKEVYALFTPPPHITMSCPYCPSWPSEHFTGSRRSNMNFKNQLLLSRPMSAAKCQTMKAVWQLKPVLKNESSIQAFIHAWESLKLLAYFNKFINSVYIFIQLLPRFLLHHFQHCCEFFKHLHLQLRLESKK